MMGERQRSQERLFYEFCLEDRVPAGHLLRKIDAVLDLSWLRVSLAPFYSHTGCPSVDPELIIRMMLIGYCYSIRSDRRLCQAVEMNLAYRWFCRLGLEDKVPDHSTFSVNRHGRFRESEVLRQVFENVVRGCMGAGLVGGEGFAVDASVIEADASRFERVVGAGNTWYEVEGATEVDIQTAKSLYDRGALFVDVSSQKTWTQRHIPGPVNLPYFRTSVTDTGWFNEHNLAKIAEKTQEIVMHCYEDGCHRGVWEVAKAAAWGYSTLHFLKDGAGSWEAAGFPVEKADFAP